MIWVYLRFIGCFAFGDYGNIGQPFAFWFYFEAMNRSKVISIDLPIKKKTPLRLKRGASSKRKKR